MRVRRCSRDDLSKLLNQRLPKMAKHDKQKIAESYLMFERNAALC